MRVEVRLFGGLPDRVGSSRIDVELPAEATVGDLRTAVAAAYPALAPLLARTSVAVDLEVARDEEPLAEAREVALLPPVAGGAGGRSSGERRVLTGLRAGPLDLEAAIDEVSGPEVGGIVTFLGTVRDHAPDLDGVVGLEYSAYPEMVERVLATIADELLADHPDLRGVALLHRVGDLAVGDHTILVVCAAAHRGPAFDACRDALERVKDRAPVWKREHTADGASRWVGLGGPTPEPPGGPPPTAG